MGEGEECQTRLPYPRRQGSGATAQAVALDSRFRGNDEASRFAGLA
jgi:hypothetical protein